VADATVDIPIVAVPRRAAAPAVDRWYTDTRLVGLSRFAMAITFLNVIGHLFLGFEPSWITPFVALATTYSVDILGETLDAVAQGRSPAYAGSIGNLVSFLLPAHITALAVGMLLYAGVQLWAVVFACALAIASKYIFRLPRLDKKNASIPTYKHYLNPSNIGIAATLILFPGVGIAPPYQFAENLFGVLYWLLPLIVICTGSFLNIKATARFPLIVAWLGTFAAQALLRAWINETPWNAGLGPMTGFAFILFTFYMITDPGTTPSRPREQVVFGASVALVYGALMELHIVFGLFFALAIVAVARAILSGVEFVQLKAKLA
jgi:hypothetical protein